MPLPASLIVQASFTAGSKDQRFDFTFTEYSVASAPTTIDGATRLAMDIPNDADGVLAMLRERRDQVKEIVARGSLTEVWVPALQAKDLALALELHAREFPDRQRQEMSAAVRDIVVAAFRLDAAGDRGEREEVARASDTLLDGRVGHRIAVQGRP